MDKPFKIEQLFNIINNPQLDKENFKFSENAEYPYFTRTENNNGILGYVEYLDEEHKIQGNSLAVGMISMKFHYMSHDFYAGQFTKTLIPKFIEFDETLALFFISILNKHSSYYQSYLVREFITRVSNTTVELPVIENSDPDHEYTVDDIDWQYMRDRITELERDRITELDAYLQATGLNDYELTDEDKKVLSLFSKRTSNKDEDLEDIGEDEVRFGEFVVKDVLNVDQTKSVVAKSDLVDGTIPYVTRTVSDNGYMGTCGNTDKVNVGNCITIGAETGIAFYQPSDFVAGNKVYRLSREGLGIKEYLYLASVLNMQTKNYSYSNARIPEKIKAEKFLLPVIENSNPDHEYTVDDIDWQYMERYIRAIEKVVIADVVKYKDKVIEATRKVINTQDEDF